MGKSLVDWRDENINDISISLDTFTHIHKPSKISPGMLIMLEICSL